MQIYDCMSKTGIRMTGNASYYLCFGQKKYNSFKKSAQGIKALTKLTLSFTNLKAH